MARAKQVFAEAWARALPQLSLRNLPPEVELVIPCHLFCDLRHMHPPASSAPNLAQSMADRATLMQAERSPLLRAERNTLSEKSDGCPRVFETDPTPRISGADAIQVPHCHSH